MKHSRGDRAKLLWLLAVATVLFALSLSGSFEELTSPHLLSWHVLLRKAYSIGAFAVVAFLLARLQNAVTAAAAFRIGWTIALYSAAIEVGQAIVGSHEGLRWNLADTMMGFVGGLIGGYAHAGWSRVVARKLGQIGKIDRVVHPMEHQD
ncbi:MAG TPA: hypothetical protein VIG51_08190 [Candidatus Baltobacteraceae bacterium]|jgi:hypothetical protein